MEDEMKKDYLALENRVRALEFLERHKETHFYKKILQDYGRGAAKFCYENLELIGALALFLLVNWVVWRKLGE